MKGSYMSGLFYKSKRFTSVDCFKVKKYNVLFERYVGLIPNKIGVCIFCFNMRKNLFCMDRGYKTFFADVIFSGIYDVDFAINFSQTNIKKAQKIFDYNTIYINIL
jgi:hypothetical protein